MAEKLNYAFMSHSKDLNPKDRLRSIDNDSLNEQESLRYKQDTHYRSIFSWWVIVVVSVWVITTIVISFLEGFGIICLPTTAFATLLATTTANILGLAYIVLKGMFPSNKE